MQMMKQEEEGVPIEAYVGPNINKVSQLLAFEHSNEDLDNEGSIDKHHREQSLMTLTGTKD